MRQFFKAISYNTVLQKCDTMNLVDSGEQTTFVHAPQDLYYLYIYHFSSYIAIEWDTILQL